MELSKFFFPLASLIIAAATLILAWIIPKKIMVNQIFAGLVAEYRKPEMGGAIFALFHFYKYCTDNGLNINDEYIKLHDAQIKKSYDVLYKKKHCNAGFPVDFSSTLHFQRRLVAQFYADIAYLRQACFLVRLSKGKLKNWFTQDDLKLLEIILYLHHPAKNVFVNLERVCKPQKIKVPMYESIYKLYKEVKKNTI